MYLSSASEVSLLYRSWSGSLYLSYSSDLRSVGSRCLSSLFVPSVCLYLSSVCLGLSSVCLGLSSPCLGLSSACLGLSFDCLGLSSLPLAGGLSTSTASSP